MIHDILPYFERELTQFYSNKEVQNMAFWCIHSISKLSRSEYLLSPNSPLSEDKLSLYKSIVSRLQNFEPLQYILGECEFYGFSLKVSPSCLIPRPETEELVHWILQHNFTKAIDIGTGSACISIALAKNKEAQITALDISSDALSIARENCKKNTVDIHFIEHNILNDIYLKTSFDLIVSNPPYVLESEKTLMNNNVLDYEPHLALFVSDNDALIYYRRIIDFSKVHLQRNGLLFLEINEQKSVEIKELLENNGFENVLIKKDMQGKNRMVKAVRKS